MIIFIELSYKMLKSIIATALFTICAVYANVLTLNKRNFIHSQRSVINGYDAPPRPFYVRLAMLMLTNGVIMEGSCGGTIIDPRWVLTATHCLNSPDLFEVWVEVGDFTEHNSERIKILGEVFIHEGFENTEYEENGTVINDVALLKLQHKVPKTSKMLPLCRKDYGNSTLRLKLAGMGMIYQGKPHTGKPNPKDLELQEVELSETSQCPKLWEGHTPVSEMEVCVLGNNKSACYGDSGGALFPVDGEDEAMCVYGVSSYASESCIGGVTIFMRVPYFLEWIENTIRLNLD